MATLADRLAEAENALHDLTIGKAARVYVDQNGERVEYVGANRSSLVAYIADLKRQLGQRSCEGPMRPFYL